VGTLGELLLRPGYYLYVGSAIGSGGLAGRLRHHAAVASRPHWHVDYLRAVARLEQTWFCCDRERREHLWACALSQTRTASVPLSGFGASDCACQSHLFYFRCLPSAAGFRHRVRRMHPDQGALRVIIHTAP
jgi:Uri superfamily endonuclease